MSRGNLSYTYDPADPFPGLGGTTPGNGVGPARQNPNAGRPDQIVFEMAVATTMNEAVQTFWYGPDTPSSVSLPVYTTPSENN